MTQWELIWPVVDLKTQSRIMSGIIWRNLGFDNPRLFFQSRINPRLILDQKRVADLNLRPGLFNLRLILDYF